MSVNTHVENTIRTATVVIEALEAGAPRTDTVDASKPTLARMLREYGREDLALRLEAA